MTVTINLPPEVQEWMSRKLEAGEFATPAEFIQSRLYEDWLEEKVGEALQEPASPMTPEDWADARRKLEERIASGK